MSSENPERYRESTALRIPEFVGAPSGESTSAFELIKCRQISTTLATSARLERQDELSTSLYERVVELDERIGARGEAVRALDETSALPVRASARQRLEQVKLRQHISRHLH